MTVTQHKTITVNFAYQTFIYMFAYIVKPIVNWPQPTT